MILYTIDTSNLITLTSSVFKYKKRCWIDSYYYFKIS